LVISTAYLGLAIVPEAALDYLGAGIQEPQPSWGLMMSGSATTLALTAPWIVLFPGVAISIVVLASNLLGDAIRDVLDPKLQRNV
jgi:peptide/nickel transport system permease protein